MPLALLSDVRVDENDQDADDLSRDEQPFRRDEKRQRGEDDSQRRHQEIHDERPAKCLREADTERIAPAKGTRKHWDLIMPVRCCGAFREVGCKRVRIGCMAVGQTQRPNAGCSEHW